MGLIYVVWLFTAAGSSDLLDRVVSDIGLTPMELFAAGLLLRAARSWPRGSRYRWSLALLASAVAVDGIVSIWWAIDVERLGASAAGSAANLAFLGYYPLALAGVLIQPRAARSGLARRQFVLDALILVVSGAAVLWLTTAPAPLTSAGPLRALSPLVTYPLGDLLVLIAFADLMLRVPRREGRAALNLLALALMAWMVGDVFFARNLLGSGPRAVSWGDLAFTVSFTALAWSAEAYRRLATVPPEPAPPAREPSFGPVPSLAAALFFALLLTVAVASWSIPLGPLVVGAVLLAGLLLTRQALAVEHNTRLAAERSLRDGQLKLAAQLRELEKLEAVGQLAGGIAHDFNNLLAAILAYAEVAAAELGPDHAVRHDVGEIQRAAERAAELTRQLLAIGRRQVIEPESLPLGAVLAEMRRMLECVLGARVRVEVECPADVAPVWADRGQMERVLLNLAVNARDAMPDGGVLTLRAANADGDPTCAGLKLSPAHCVRLDVVDTGRGMDEATRVRVFEPFFTTKPAGQGSGLGLASVYGILRQSGGAIAVESAPNRGTRFRIYLPRAQGSGRSPDAAAPARPDASDRGTVLLVEDEPSIRTVTARVLRQRGHTVLSAENAADARAAAARHRAAIDLLITDVMMPGTSGPMLAQELQREDPRLQVLFISGYAASSVTELQNLGPTRSFLQKPFTIHELLAKVDAALAGRAAPVGARRPAPLLTPAR
jgi:signal transduction histidine kinase/CheY-like chemotaxis protein